MKFRTLIMTGVTAFTVSACSSTAPQPIKTVAKVDLARFMGDWYVIANIPTFIEKDAYNAIESYALNADGTIATTFRFRKGGFDGKHKHYTPTGFVRDNESNAVWDMQFLWPFKSEYRIVYLKHDYSVTIIGRSKRDYVWLMARMPSIPDSEYQVLKDYIEQLGYDINQLQKVPQKVAR